MIDNLAFLVLVLLGSSGVTLIVSRGWVFLSLRQRFEGHPLAHRLIRCPMCLGFWFGFSGWILAALTIAQMPASFFVSIGAWAETCFAGGAVSFLSTSIGGADHTGA